MRNERRTRRRKRGAKGFLILTSAIRARLIRMGFICKRYGKNVQTLPALGTSPPTKLFHKKVKDYD
jgi:hypothetical protein